MEKKKVKSPLDIVRCVMVAIAISTVTALAASIKLGYTEVGTYDVVKVERVWNTGAEDRGFYSYDCYYMVYTDSGVFKIELVGLNAYAYGAGIVKPGKSYRFKSRGARVEPLGLYPNIIDAQEQE